MDSFGVSKFHDDNKFYRMVEIDGMNDKKYVFSVELCFFIKEYEYIAYKL